ncbi:MAG: chemotaxis-specific protein-glutamate methyltransferase CheB [Bacteroidales bacterium]|nr:chemotaxis-specific protein-glutamate methyltransferase CheB [Bacteroidales bacterium]
MRIAIVNDLALARTVLKRVVESVPGYRVAWEAVNGADAVTQAAADRPDVLLMDLIMPVLDGAGATRQIMRQSPCPILVVTASVGANHAQVYEALGAGGLDVVRTPTLGPSGTIVGAEPLLARLAKLALRHGPQSALTPMTPRARPLPRGSAARAPSLLAIGASTGGPDALASVLAGLGSSCTTPVIIVQHIGEDYAQGLADWLTRRTGRTILVPTANTTLEPGRVYLAGGDDHLRIDQTQSLQYDREPAHYSYRPSIDVLFASLARYWKGTGVAVLLTGMGNDGARGLLQLKSLGWLTIAQDEATSVVYGMPKAAAELQACTEILPLAQIGPRCGEWLQNSIVRGIK